MAADGLSWRQPVPRVHVVDVPMHSSETFYLSPFFDLHIDSIMCDYDGLRRVCETRAALPHHHAIACGDVCDLVLPPDLRRFRSSTRKSEMATRDDFYAAAVENVIFDVAAQLAPLLAHHFMATTLPQALFLNVNVPNAPLKEIKGVDITRLARRTFMELIKEGHDGRRKYYWIDRGKPNMDFEEGTDMWAIANHRISVTPLHADLTNNAIMPALEGLGAGLLKGLTNRDQEDDA